MNVRDYATLIFDCDGVLLDSNRLKTQGFHHSALPYGKRAADALVDFHTRRGGISRYEKFKWFLETYIGAFEQKEIDTLLRRYANYVWDALLRCEISDCLPLLREQTSKSRWVVASGGDQSELRALFTLREIDKYFDGGIYGSPMPKGDILEGRLTSGDIRLPGLFIGDSEYDHVVARANGLDFLFVSGWSEFKSWREYTSSNNLTVVTELAALTTSTVEINGAA